jgi:hypothetical protein
MIPRFDNKFWQGHDWIIHTIRARLSTMHESAVTAGLDGFARISSACLDDLQLLEEMLRDHHEGDITAPSA